MGGPHTLQGCSVWPPRDRQDPPGPGGGHGDQEHGKQQLAMIESTYPNHPTSKSNVMSFDLTYLSAVSCMYSDGPEDIMGCDGPEILL